MSTDSQKTKTTTKLSLACAKGNKINGALG